MEKIIAPKGTRDIYYPDIVHWQALEEKIRVFFSGYV